MLGLCHSRVHEDTFRGSGNPCEREVKLTPSSLLAPR